MDNVDRVVGSLVGLACGDAVGTTLEFMPPGSFEPISDMVGGGPFNLLPGQWTDDTSMALCLGESLLQKKGFDPIDQMNRYCNWYHYGYMSSTGDCFDIGNTVASALNNYLKTKNPFSGSVDEQSSGNGSLMRLAPIAMFYRNNISDLEKYSAESSRTTHGSAECIDACRYFSSLLVNAFKVTDKDSLFRLVYKPETTNIATISTLNFFKKNYNQLVGSGYVIQSLEAALWCFYHSTSFEDAVLMSANLGNDADTTAAICGQIAGAYYGVKAIPHHWIEKLTMKDEILKMANHLFASGLQK